MRHRLVQSTDADEAKAEGRANYPPFRDSRRTARQPFIFTRKKTYTSPPMVGTPMQFPQCAMPETTPANKRRLCAMTDDE